MLRTLEEFSKIRLTLYRLLIRLSLSLSLVLPLSLSTLGLLYHLYRTVVRPFGIRVTWKCRILKDKDWSKGFILPLFFIKSSIKLLSALLLLGSRFFNCMTILKFHYLLFKGGKCQCCDPWPPAEPLWLRMTSWPYQKNEPVCFWSLSLLPSGRNCGPMLASNHILPFYLEHLQYVCNYSFMEQSGKSGQNSNNNNNKI